MALEWQSHLKKSLRQLNKIIDHVRINIPISSVDIKVTSKDVCDEADRKMATRSAKEKRRASTLNLQRQNMMIKEIEKLKENKALESLSNAVAHMNAFDHNGWALKPNYYYSVPMIFSEDEDSIENYQKSGKNSMWVSPNNKKGQKKENNQEKDIVNDNIKSLTHRHWSSQSNLTQMSTITKKRQQYLERTLYRTKNMSKFIFFFLYVFNLIKQFLL